MRNVIRLMRSVRPTLSAMIMTAALAASVFPSAAMAHGADDQDVIQQGTASYYADRFQGRRTASGQPFDQRQLTAAHRSLPFGTKVLVTRADTGQSVEVTINDRGPFVKGRVIDLSKSAADELGMLYRGTAPVRLTYLP